MLSRSILSALSFYFYLGVASAASHPTVYLIRHAEKPENPHEHHGLAPDGTIRAQCLRHVFGTGSGYDIGYLMAPHVASNGEHGRAYLTVLPLAGDLGLTVDTHCKRNNVTCVAETVRSYDGPGNILISWRHGKMDEIELELGALKPIGYPDDRYDIIWTDPWPYGNVTDIRSEECPGLDVQPGLVDQA
ncbi:hypothetical protein N7535_000732 [Penicillium sp. DV-2018c]|nr:hypothetical protein N7461_006016 [Penicillium sp. DV-2018c]KAJ5582112.1 hypothetical protein N7535_000732 [Penicillium sp. DV-2018c]